MITAGIDNPHDEYSEVAWETISKQRLHGALLAFLRLSAAAEFGIAMHPEQGLCLSTPFAAWLGQSPFPWIVMDPGNLY